MSMSKKDFIALANAIRELREKTIADKDAQRAQKGMRDPYVAGTHDGAIIGISHTLDAIATVCQSQNPRFKRQRWLAYIAGECGPNGGKVKVQS